MRFQFARNGLGGFQMARNRLGSLKLPNGGPADDKLLRVAAAQLLVCVTSSQSNLHGLGFKRRGDGRKPRSRVWPALRLQKCRSVWQQGWQKHALEEVKVASLRCVRLPFVRPIDQTCIRQAGIASPVNDVRPARTSLRGLRLQGLV